MAQRVRVMVSAAERDQLAVIAADRNRPRKHVERARIVLAPAQSTRETRIPRAIEPGSSRDA